VQQAQEAAAEAKAQRLADLGFVAQAAVVELELFQRVAQLVVFAGFGGVQAGKDLRLDFLEAGSGSVAGPALLGSFLSSVSVSPTLAACSSLMPQMMKPTSPALSVSRGTLLGVNTPICSMP
jgi:hypothetical protein